MSGMVWDEAQRVWAAIGALAGRIGCELDESTVARLQEAVSALEAAIAEAWPPDAVRTPVRTDEGGPIEELAALVAAGAMPVHRPDLLPGVLATTAAQDADPVLRVALRWPLSDLASHKA